MATPAQIRAKDKYRAKNYDQINIQVPKGTRDRWKAQADAEGKSLAAFIVSRVELVPVPPDAPSAAPPPKL